MIGFEKKMCFAEFSKIILESSGKVAVQLILLFYVDCLTLRLISELNKMCSQIPGSFL